MNSGINKEFHIFSSRIKHLRQILRDTQKCFKDINSIGSFNGEILTAEFSAAEEQELESLTRKPPGIIILGQNNHAKAVAVNELLGKSILPTAPDAGKTIRDKSKSYSHWRTVRLKYGKKARISYCLANSFELIGDAEITHDSSETVPLETLTGDEVIVTNCECCEPVPYNAGKGSPNRSSSSGLDERHEMDGSFHSTEDDHLPDNMTYYDDDGIDDCADLNSVEEAAGAESKLENNKTDDRESPTDNQVVMRDSAEKGRQIYKDFNRNSLVVEVLLNHPLFNDGVQIIVAQERDDMDQNLALKYLIEQSTHDLLPVFIYALIDDGFSAEEVSRLQELKELLPDIAIFFVKVPRVPDPPDTFSFSPMKKIRSALERHNFSKTSEENSQSSTQASPRCSLLRQRAVSTAQSSLKLFQQLLELGFLSILPGSIHHSDNRGRPSSDCDSVDSYAADSELVENFDDFTVNLGGFVHQVLQCHLVRVVSLLHVVHSRCLQTFIMTAFDMARDLLITPKRIHFAKEKESELYGSLMEMALKKQDEIRRIILETVDGMKDELLEKAANYDFMGVNLSASGDVTSSRDLKTCTSQIQDLVLGNLNSAVANKLLGSVDILKDSYTGVLTRCLESLEQSDAHNKDGVRTSIALKEILTSAYQVEITVRAGASIMKVLLEKMKQLIHTMPWKPAPRIDSEWKRRVAADMLNSLSETRLSKSICNQIKERLKQSHEQFSSALKQLEVRHSGRLERTEEQRLRVRKVHAPRVARLALESLSYKDFLVYGMPHQGREIGRGQYGVVYACDSWAGNNPCAIKSVVPPDDKHWNDLAMEFFYTKNVPEHDRIVSLRGSVVDYFYGGGSPSVLLIMDRLQRDLYVAIKAGLDYPGRLQVAIDVVEGIRFLHSQGLVHRDIKLKNVLLDKHNRGKITDLGFCKPEAMMSGSIVGTPIHMAPELFSGRYDNTVDVYAFGILFWYVCAGHVRLPYNFEQCTNKEMLWTSVRRGVRPERLTQFDDDCWELMQICWDGEPCRRPLLGLVEPKLITILRQIRVNKGSLKIRRGQPKHDLKATRNESPRS